MTSDMRRRENSTSEELITGYGRNSWDIKEPWPKTQQAQSEKDRSEGAAGACSVEQMLIVQSITEVSLQPYSVHCATKINSNTTVRGGSSCIWIASLVQQSQ